MSIIQKIKQALNIATAMPRGHMVREAYARDKTPCEGCELCMTIKEVGQLQAAYDAQWAAERASKRQSQSRSLA